MLLKNIKYQRHRSLSSFELHSITDDFKDRYDVITTWVDQKVLKLLAYLFNYTTELYKTYTEY